MASTTPPSTTRPAVRPIAIRHGKRRRSGGQRAITAGTLLTLALVTGFAFGGTGLEGGPQSAAQATAARVAALRIATGEVVLRNRGGAVRDPVRQPLLLGASDVPAADHATRVRVASVGIDTAVRPMGLLFQSGQLLYDTPSRDAGQYAGSGRPGEPGNLVIGGHVSERGAKGVFAQLPKVGLGDVVEVFSNSQTYRYKIVEVRVVAPEATVVMAQTQEARVTLITCLPEPRFQHRLVVVGELL